MLRGFLCLVSVILLNAFKIHPCCSMDQYSFYGQVILWIRHILFDKLLLDFIFFKYLFMYLFI